MEKDSVKLLPLLEGGQLRIGTRFVTTEGVQARQLWCSDQGAATAAIKIQEGETFIKFLLNFPFQNEALEHRASKRGIVNGRQIKLKFSVETATLRAIAITKANELGFVVESKYAPFVFEKEVETEPKFRKRSMRTVDFTPGRALARSNAYAFTVPRSPENEEVLNGFFGLSEYLDWVKPKLVVESSYFSAADQTENGLSQQSSKASSPLFLEPQFDPSRFLDVELPFEVWWHIHVLIHATLLFEDQVDERFLERLASAVTNDGVDFAVAALRKLVFAGMPIQNPAEELKRISNALQASARKSAQTSPFLLETNQVLVYRLVITPCRVYALPPEPEPSNRVLRNFSHLSKDGRFVRVSYRDEDLGDLRARALQSNEWLPRTLKEDFVPRSPVFDRFLRTGFLFCGRHYEFLAMSASQARSFSHWAFSQEVAPGSVSVDKIRSFVGDFNGIRNVAKHAVRPGIALSSTIPTVTITQDQVIQIPDVRRNGLCFTDGIGRISPDLADKVARFLPGVNKPPCAFQIRFGGCKGMVAVYPPWAGKDLLGLRKSMAKFACSSMQLEVISWPIAHQPAFLSRQLIQLLEARGIAPRALEAFQEEHLRTFDAVQIAGQGSAPLARVRALLGDRSPALSVLEAALAQLAAAPRGTAPALAPFQLRVLEKAREHHLKELRDRAHVFVPDGALLLGCTDEYRLLRPGQVFVRLSSPSKVITGLVMVYRNPGLNPRDVRVLRAVDCPGLHHLEDVVVFSQLGERPEPGNLSGGDLDGDKFWVMWDKRLVPKTREPPSRYLPSPKMPDEDRNLTLQDDKFFQLEYQLKDNLGAICAAHMALCDQRIDGPNDPDCLRLAQQAADAANFAKTGFPVVLTEDLRPQAYPDFMQKPGKESYESHKALGKLFRRACNELNKAESARAKEEAERKAQGASEARARAAPEGDAALLQMSVGDERIQWARALKAEYDGRVRDVMSTYGVESEADLVVGTSGSASGSDGGHVADDEGEANADEEGEEWSDTEEGDGTESGRIWRRNGKRNRKDEAERRERMRGVFGGLVAQFRTRFERGPPSVLGQEDEPASKKAKLDARLLNKAACFQATYGPEGKGGAAGVSGKSERLLESFWWLLVGSGE